MATVYDSTFELFCNKKESEFIIFKEKNLARILLFSLWLPTWNTITVFYCLLTSCTRGKSPKCCKIGSKPGVKSTAQISGGFKKLYLCWKLVASRENYEFNFFIYYSIFSKIKQIKRCYVHFFFLALHFSCASNHMQIQRKSF